jgi:MFS family permease
MNPLVVRSAIVASLGGLIFGFDTAVISGTTDALKEVFHLSANGLGFTVAIALIGTIVGALIAGKLTVRGRSSLSVIRSSRCQCTAHPAAGGADPDAPRCSDH